MSYALLTDRGVIIELRRVLDDLVGANERFVPVATLSYRPGLVGSGQLEAPLRRVRQALAGSADRAGEKITPT